MKILHFSDLHLDHAFVDDPFTLAGRDRRNTLKTILGDIISLARNEQVDAVTIAGDLFDTDTVMPATLSHLSDAFAELAPIPVLIAPGLADAYHAEALYARWDFPANVHVFAADSPTPCSITPELTIWGMAASTSLLGDRLDGIRVNDGVNLLLAYAPGENAVGDVLRAAMLDYALLGGEHCYRQFEGGVYPGSPDVLEPQVDPCPHGVALIDLEAGTIAVKHVETARWRYATHEVDLTSCSQESDVERLVQAVLEGDGEDHCLHTVILTGEPRCALHLDKLQNRLSAHVSFRMQLRLWSDIETLASEPTVRGLFVSRFIEQIASAAPDDQPRLMNALQLALQALDTIEVPYNAVDPN